jgi:hypothetical protein
MTWNCVFESNELIVLSWVEYFELLLFMLILAFLLLFLAEDFWLSVFTSLGFRSGKPNSLIHN